MASQEQPRAGSGVESEASLTIEVNGETTRLPAGTFITDLLAKLGMGGQRVAVAINRDVVPRSLHERTRLTDGDTVEILEAVGGG